MSLLSDAKHSESSYHRATYSFLMNHSFRGRAHPGKGTGFARLQKITLLNANVCYRFGMGTGGATNATMCALPRDSYATRCWHCWYRRTSERTPVSSPKSKIDLREIRHCAVHKKAQEMGCLNIKLSRPRDEVTDRLLVWHDQAKLAGRKCRAETLLALAWYSYDRPSDTVGRTRSRPLRLSPAVSAPLMISSNAGGLSAAMMLGIGHDEDHEHLSRGSIYNDA